MGVDGAPLGFRATFFGAWTPKLDPHPRSLPRWPCSRAAFRQARRCLSERGRRRVLLRDLELSLLARDGFVRESLPYLAYAHLRFRPGTLPPALRRTLPLGALGICFNCGAPASFCSLER